MNAIAGWFVMVGLIFLGYQVEKVASSPLLNAPCIAAKTLEQPK